jgi:hypothetical protein
MFANHSTSAGMSRNREKASLDNCRLDFSRTLTEFGSVADMARPEIDKP